MSDDLSVPQVRKLILHCQRLPQRKAPGSALDQTAAIIQHLGYVQIDTISVVQRAHHHTIWNRNFRYKPQHLDQLLEQKRIFEYWSHAAAWLPMSDYRFSLPRKSALSNGAMDHWYPRNRKLISNVLARIREEGPLQARDFEQGENRTADWQRKPAKQALEYLFMQGDIMVPRRRNFHKVYDLTERVLPSAVDTRSPTTDEYARYLIRRFLQANGIGQLTEAGYLRKSMKSPLTTAAEDMLLAGELQSVSIKGKQYLVLPESLSLLNKPLQRQSLQILSPFDNLLIQRKRMQQWFDFDYQIECYVPANKRQFGYFCLPILWGGNLVARMDCKADRKNRVLSVHTLHLESSLKKTADFFAALRKHLPLFLAFNDCDAITASAELRAKIQLEPSGEIK